MLPEDSEIVQSGGIGERASSKTYRADLDKNKITGIIDGKEALEQAICFALLTQRYEYAIYPHSYGTDWSGAIGEGFLKAMAAAKTAVTDSLMCDDRIIGIDNFEFEKKERGMRMSFRVKSVFGNIDEEGEVGENGFILYRL